MRAHQDHSVNELSNKVILNLLQQKSWSTPTQAITSAITNDNDSKAPGLEWLADLENTAGINAFSDIKFDKQVKTILDVGGGKFDVNRHYMKHERNIDLLVWDPYNRTQKHNKRVEERVMNNKVDAVTSMSVLNVIAEVDVRLAHLIILKLALKNKGKAYIKIWPGEGVLQASYLPSATDQYYQANAYADRFLREVEIVFGKGNVLLDKTVPNLIVATKKAEGDTDIHEIVSIKKIAAREYEILNKIKLQSFTRLYYNTDIYKLFTRNYSIFKKLNEAMLTDEMTTKYGLVPIFK